MVLGCEFCGGCGIEFAVLPFIGFLPIGIRWLWQKIRIQLMFDPWIVYDNYHNCALLEWHSCYESAVRCAKHANKETDCINRFQVKRLPRHVPSN